MIIDLVLPNGKIIKQNYTYKGPRSLNDYSANTSNSNLPDIPKTPRSVMNMMSESPGEFKGAIYSNNDYAYAPNYSTQDPGIPPYKNNTIGYF